MLFEAWDFAYLSLASRLRLQQKTIRCWRAHKIKREVGNYEQNSFTELGMPDQSRMSLLIPEFGSLSKEAFNDLESEIYLPCIDLELRLGEQAACGWLGYFFSRLQSTKVESLSIICTFTK